MKILMISESGDGLGIAHTMAKEGHDVSMYIKDNRFDWAGKGLINRVKSWRPLLKSADFVVCDMVGFGHLESVFKKFGLPVLGCSKIADMIELDRKKGHELLEKSGIGTPETEYMKSPADAAIYENSWTGPGYVLKPSGNISTALTKVCRDKYTFKYTLSKYDSNQELIVQKIVDGVEVSTEGWFNGRDWISPFNHTFEEKRFMPGDAGPNTGCMGNVVITTRGNKLVDNTVRKLTPFLKKVGYRGPIDINSIVNESGVYALEITPRLGYDAIEALAEGLSEPITDLLFETAMGVKKVMNIGNMVYMVVRVSLPPWPHDKPSADDRGMPISNLTRGILKHVFLTDVYLEDGVYKYAAGDGVVYKASARGVSIKEASKRIYRTIDAIDLSDGQYRTDIGSRVATDMKKLTEWGYL